MGEKRKSVNYVDNVEFYNEMVQFRIDNADRVRDGLRPIVSNSIGKKILDICQHLSYKSNFIRYSFRDEMVDDAIINCLTYIWNFDPEKSRNPFGYFSFTAFRAMVRRIQKQKKLSEQMKEYIEQMKIEFEPERLDVEMTDGIRKDINESFYGVEQKLSMDGVKSDFSWGDADSHEE